MSRKMVLATLLAAVVLPATGQTQKTETKTVVLKAARIFDGKSNSVTTNGVVVIAGGKIVAVGANTAIPAGAEVIDLGDATLLRRNFTRWWIWV